MLHPSYRAPYGKGRERREKYDKLFPIPQLTQEADKAINYLIGCHEAMITQLQEIKKTAIN